MPGRYTARYKYKNMPVIQKYVFDFSDDLAIILLFHFTRVGYPFIQYAPIIHIKILDRWNIP